MKQLLFITILLSLIGCNRFASQKPADLIEQAQMVQILVDIHVADALVDQKYGTNNPNLPVTTALYSRIYKNYGITAARYQSSYKYYESHPEIMDKMYEQVITELSKKEALIGKAK